MLNHPTLEKLQTLRLSGMYKTLSEQMNLPEVDTLSFEERLGLFAAARIEQPAVPGEPGVGSVRKPASDLGFGQHRLQLREQAAGGDQRDHPVRQIGDFRVGQNDDVAVNAQLAAVPAGIGDGDACHTVHYADRQFSIS